MLVGKGVAVRLGVGGSDDGEQGGNGMKVGVVGEGCEVHGWQRNVPRLVGHGKAEVWKWEI